MNATFINALYEPLGHAWKTPGETLYPLPAPVWNLLRLFNQLAF